MKFDLIKTLISVAAGLLISYGMYSDGLPESGWLFPVVSFIELTLFLLAALAFKVEWLRSMANIKIFAWLSFVVDLIMNIVFSRICVSVPTYVISNGCLALIFVLIIYSLMKANKTN